MIKRILSFVLTLALALSVTACTTTSSNSEKKEETEQIVLQFPTWQATEPGFKEFWEKAISEFESKHQNVKINMYQVPFANYIDTLTTLYGANTPPQITHIASRYFAKFQDMGWFEPLDERLKETDILSKWSSLQGNLTNDGKNYGLLLLGNAYSMFYNEKLFADAGVEVPKDVNSFMKAAEKLTMDTNKDGNPDVFGFASCQTTDTNFYNEASVFVVGQGGQWADKGDLKAMVSDKTITALTNFQTIFKNNWSPSGLTVEQKRQYFTEGKIAMIFDGPWVGSLIAKAPENVKENLKVTSVPFENIPGSMSNSLHIPASISDKEKELVWDFIKMVSQDDFQRDYMKFVGSPSPKANMITEELLKEKPLLGQFADDAEKAQEILPSGYEKDYAEFSRFAIDSVMQIVTKPYADVKTTLESLQKQIENNLK